MDKTKLSKEYTNGLKHFYDCIDFGKCNLDAEAIQFMNELPGKVVKALEQRDDLLAALKRISDIEDARFTHSGFDLEVNNISKVAIAAC